MRSGHSHAVLTFERGISAAIGYQGEEEGFEPFLGEPTQATAGSTPAVQPLRRRTRQAQPLEATAGSIDSSRDAIISSHRCGRVQRGVCSPRSLARSV